MRTLIATAPGMITHELVTVNEAADDVLTIALLNGETMGGIARWAAKDELLAIADNVAAGTPAPEIARQLVIVLADLEHAGVPEDDSGYAKVAEALRMVEAADATGKPLFTNRVEHPERAFPNRPAYTLTSDIIGAMADAMLLLVGAVRQN
jgi:hypothetical protein